MYTGKIIRRRNGSVKVLQKDIKRIQKVKRPKIRSFQSYAGIGFGIIQRRRKPGTATFATLD